jgi:hypothetical protein
LKINKLEGETIASVLLKENLALCLAKRIRVKHVKGRPRLRRE